jgi:hypothetical protein
MVVAGKRPVGIDLARLVTVRHVAPAAPRSNADNRRL